MRQSGIAYVRRRLGLCGLAVLAFSCAHAQTIDAASDDATIGGISIEERTSLNEPTWQAIYLHQEMVLRPFRVSGKLAAQGYNRVSDRLSVYHYTLDRNRYWESGGQLRGADRVNHGDRVTGLNSLMLGGGFLRWLDGDQRYRFRISATLTKSIDEQYRNVLAEARLTNYSQRASDPVGAYSERKSVGLIYRAANDTGFAFAGWTVEGRFDSNLYLRGDKIQFGALDSERFPQRRLYARNVVAATLSPPRRSAIKSTVGYAYRPRREAMFCLELFGGLRLSGVRPTHGFRLYVTKFL